MDAIFEPQTLLFGSKALQPGTVLAEVNWSNNSAYKTGTE